VSPKLAIRATIRAVLGVVLLAAALFGSAGTVAWPMAWAYLGVVAVSQAAALVWFLRHDPDLIVERSRWHKDAKGWDKVLAPLIAVVIPLAIMVVAGLDRRFVGAGMPVWASALGLAIGVAGYAFIVWAVVANPFFSSVVRLQRDRGHRVASGGPYALVRHPGYVGASVAGLALPFVFGSFWALLPAGVYVLALVVRTGLEDATLWRELEGYADYAARVRFRLIPGIW